MSAADDITPVDSTKVSNPPSLASITALTTCVEALRALTRTEQVRILASVREFLGLDNEGTTVVNKTVIQRPLGGSARG